MYVQLYICAYTGKLLFQNWDDTTGDTYPEVNVQNKMHISIVGFIVDYNFRKYQFALSDQTVLM